MVWIGARSSQIEMALRHQKLLWTPNQNKPSTLQKVHVSQYVPHHVTTFEFMIRPKGLEWWHRASTSTHPILVIDHPWSFQLWLTNVDHEKKTHWNHQHPANFVRWDPFQEALGSISSAFSHDKAVPPGSAAGKCRTVAKATFPNTGVDDKRL